MGSKVPGRLPEGLGEYKMVKQQVKYEVWVQEMVFHVVLHDSS